MNRAFNFYAGPATLPQSVLETAQRELVDYRGAGMSIMETSHRSALYDEVHQACVDGIVRLLGVPETHTVLLLGGGATLQFAMVPMNLAGGAETSCDIIASGSWAKKAIDDAKKICSVNVVWDGKPEGYNTLPDSASIASSPGSSYLHLTSNETIQGLQWRDFPQTEAPLVADMSSDIMSRPVDVDRFGLIYAGAQKNLGPAGVTVVIVQKDLLDRVPDTVPAYLSYRTHADKNSLYNTPPVYPIYILRLVLDWITELGGIQAIADINRRKAAALYSAIDESDGYYRCPVDPAYRSMMNVVFRLPDEDAEKRFIAGAEEAGMVGLKGHRSVGGVRASIYNAMPESGVAALVEYMERFRRG